MSNNTPQFRRRTVLRTSAVAASGVGIGSLSGCIGVLGSDDDSDTDDEDFDDDFDEDDEWRMLRQGPNHTAYSAGASAVETPIEVQWTVDDFPSAIISPLVTGDTIYSNWFNFDTSDGGVRTYSTEDGSSRWTFEAGAPVFPPALDDESIYLPRADGELTALALDDQEVRWTFEAANEPGPVKVYEETIYIADQRPDPGPGSPVYAINAESGEEQWRFEGLEGPTGTSTVHGGSVYTAPRAEDPTVYAVDAESGEEQWRFEAATEPLWDPAVAHDTVYVGSQDTNAYALDAATGEEQWRFEDASDPLGKPPAVDEEMVYVMTNLGSESDTLYALEATTGELQWEFDKALGAPPTVGGDTVYISGKEYHYALDAATGEERWRFGESSVPTSEATPIDETVYVGTFEGSLYRLS